MLEVNTIHSVNADLGYELVVLGWSFSLHC